MDNQKPTETQSAVDERIAKVIARRAGASSAEQFPIIREDGTEPLRNRVPSHQIESSVDCKPFVPVREKGYKPADQISTDPVEPKPEECIVIGRVMIQPNPIAGTMEGALTPGGQAKHEVLLDGQRVLGDRAVTVVFEAIRAQQSKKGAK